MKLPVNYDKLKIPERKEIREEYVRLQKGLCWLCKEPLNGDPAKEVFNANLNLRLFPDNFLKHPIHLHHNHTTGLTIGTVHAKCNGVMWQYHGE